MLMVISVGMLASFSSRAMRATSTELRDLVLGDGHRRGQKVLGQQEEADDPKAQVAQVRELGAHLAEVELAPHVHGAPPRPVVAAELEAKRARRAPRGSTQGSSRGEHAPYTAR